ncbi:MAG: DinB family protein [Acidimicrobiia bacterium]
MSTEEVGSVPAVERVEVPLAADERDMLVAWLEWHRATLTRKCAGLTAEQLALQSCPPSDLTLLGLLRHLTDVERGWFARGVGLDAPPVYYSDQDPESDFRLPRPVTEEHVRKAFEAWLAEGERSRRVVAGLPSLDDQAVGESHTWRWILLHMIEEYARHNGHADLLRQAIDGGVGA